MKQERMKEEKRSNMDEEMEAVVSNKIIADAVLVARKVIDRAEAVAEKLAQAKNTHNEQVTKSLSDALRDVFGENLTSGRFVDVSRIPLICQSIFQTKERLDDIEDNMKWGVRIIVGAVILAILAVVIKQ